MISGGFLTNFDTKKRIDSINEMVSYMGSDAFTSLTKKEQLVYKKETLKEQIKSTKE